MAKKLIFTLLFFYLHHSFVFAQKEQCDRVYTTVEHSAFYGKKHDDMIRFIEQNFSIDTTCLDNGTPQFNSLRVKFLIDKKGNLKEIEIMEPVLSNECIASIKAIFLKMKTWTPAFQKGKPVCSYCIQNISCFKWE
ncbi:energy transducer TonB [Phnomibacter sp. MR]|uniref:energy transducer TonB n=1 Tax=Phnomibacter sp. MR TaxID=3042318 RepID=UPI003A7FA8F1